MSCIGAEVVARNMRLPEADRVVIDSRKLRDYLLSLEHPVGRFKAVFFARLGFTQERWQVFDRRLREIAVGNEAEDTERTDHGQKYVVRATLTGPAGRSARIVTVWIVLNHETAPRFVTAYPES